jgi:hypothetical protein
VAADLDGLIVLERSSEEARARLAGLTGDAYEVQWRAWRGAATVVQAAITEHAVEAGVNRYELEQQVKRAVRHPVEEPVG